MHKAANVDRRVDERGAVAAEHGLLLGLIALAIIGGVTIFGTSLQGLFDRTCDDVSTVTAGTNC